MKKILFFFVFVVYAMLSVNLVYACICGVSTTSEQQFIKASVVFVGEFQSSRRNFNNVATINTMFRVNRILKGELHIGDSVIVSTPYMNLTCGLDRWAIETPGTLWDIYASPVATNTIPPGTILRTNMCSGTKLFGAHR